MSTMLSFADNSLSMNFMSKDDIRRVCPMALRHTPTNPKISNRYVHADTETVIDDLQKLGWLPVEAKQCREKKGSAGIRSFHMLAFQNPDVVITKEFENGEKVVDCYPRIILTNSHDGFNSFKFMVGLFRCVCSNGLIIATDQMVELNIRHVNYDFDELRKVVCESISYVPVQAAVMNDMQRVMLTMEQKTALAISALRLRKGIAENAAFNVADETIADVLYVNRAEDEGDSLWNVFNVIQENLMRGNYKSASAAKPNKMRKARALTSVSKGVDFNREFFRSAYNLIPHEVEDVVAEVVVA